MAKQIRKPPQLWRAVLNDKICLVVYATNQMDAWNKIDEYLFSINAPAVPRNSISLFVTVIPTAQLELNMNE